MVLLPCFYPLERLCPHRPVGAGQDKRWAVRSRLRSVDNCATMCRPLRDSNSRAQLEKYAQLHPVAASLLYHKSSALMRD